MHFSSTTPLWSFAAYEQFPRIGGCRQRYTLGDHANFMKIIGSIEYLSARLKLVSECTSLYTKRYIVMCPRLDPVQCLFDSQVTQTMNMSSWWTKHALEPLNPNIVVMRHPDHIGSQGTVREVPPDCALAQPSTSHRFGSVLVPPRKGRGRR